jgi:hypothetical protein
MRLRNGALIFLAAAALSLSAMLWHIKDWRRSHALGDGRRLDTYGFDLSACLIPVGELLPAGIPRDGLPAMVLPRSLDARGLDSLNAAGHSAFLMPRDRVIGIALGGQARAYPLSILDWHEVVNDTLAGRAILVTWSPLSGAAAVFDRRAVASASAGESGAPVTAMPAHTTGASVREFGVSGLLYQSNLVLYDRAPAGGESLWSQLQARAVAGPAAAESLRLAVLPASLTHWAAWHAEHPETRVLAPDPARMDSYRRKPYNSYEGNDRLQFPVRPLPDRARRPLKTPVLAVQAGGARAFYLLPTIADSCGASGYWDTRQGNARLRFHYLADPPAAEARIDSAGAWQPAVSVQASWFAWYALVPAARESTRVD